MRLESHAQHIKAQANQKETFDVLSYGIFQLASAEKTGLNLHVVEHCLGIVRQFFRPNLEIIHSCSASCR